jgi:hypothetical protein
MRGGESDSVMPDKRRERLVSLRRGLEMRDAKIGAGVEVEVEDEGTFIDIEGDEGSAATADADDDAL